MKKIIKRKKIKKIFIKKKKEIKFDFISEDNLISRNETIKRFYYLGAIILIFIIVQSTLISPPQKLVNSFINDYNSKKAFLETSESMKLGINKKIFNLSKEFENLESLFFDLNKSHEFFTLIANTALINKLKILSMKKIKEEIYKTPKKDADPTLKKIEYDVFPQYVQSNFHINFEGEYINYINFINDIKKRNQGLVTESSLIKKSKNKKLNIQSVITINFTKSDE